MLTSVKCAFLSSKRAILWTHKTPVLRFGERFMSARIGVSLASNVVVPTCGTLQHGKKDMGVLLGSKPGPRTQAALKRRT
jgi:hypothetical protein